MISSVHKSLDAATEHENDGNGSREKDTCAENKKKLRYKAKVSLTEILDKSQNYLQSQKEFPKTTANYVLVMLDRNCTMKQSGILIISLPP